MLFEVDVRGKHHSLHRQRYDGRARGGGEAYALAGDQLPAPPASRQEAAGHMIDSKGFQ